METNGSGYDARLGRKREELLTTFTTAVKASTTSIEACTNAVGSFRGNGGELLQLLGVMGASTTSTDGFIASTEDSIRVVEACMMLRATCASF